MLLVSFIVTACGSEQPAPPSVATAMPTLQPTSVGTPVRTFEAGQFVYLKAETYPGTSVWYIGSHAGDKLVIRDQATGTDTVMDRSQLSTIAYVYGAAAILSTGVVPMREFPRADAAITGSLTRDATFVVANPDLCVSRPEIPGSGQSNWCYVVVLDQFSGWVPRGTFGNEWTFLFKPIT